MDVLVKLIAPDFKIPQGGLIFGYSACRSIFLTLLLQLTSSKTVAAVVTVPPFAPFWSDLQNTGGVGEFSTGQEVCDAIYSHMIFVLDTSHPWKGVCRAENNINYAWPFFGSQCPLNYDGANEEQHRGDFGHNGYGDIYAGDNVICVADGLHVWHDKPAMCPGKQASVVSVGDPIYPLIGVSSYDVELEAGVGGLKLRYDMRSKLPNDNAGREFQEFPLPSFGLLVESNLHKRLIYQSGDGANVQASRGLGRWVSFAVSGGVFVPDAGVRDTLVAISGGWRYVDA
ncbi:hypothetical protein, partial [Ideonella azotifigens]|uniref:hypothetical protein n=2 Tax=Ideonella azotifigens TaxID=513160 RepID=UPI0031D4C6B5